mmetsp:Transcript_40817/g.91826  ORF Transcript_40817/g.91826 Transcript_40817/m.91826 type:complete len:126 (+) Transcript_40817:571-948(+)
MQDSGGKKVVMAAAKGRGVARFLERASVELQLSREASPPPPPPGLSASSAARHLTPLDPIVCVWLRFSNLFAKLTRPAVGEVAEDVPCREVEETEVLRQRQTLGALPRPGRAQHQDQPHLIHEFG